ncbi:hypothetical protein DFR49_3234 [Hephaestia caeni]|uniref:Uncharacterized protein n=1 Tax=Hephaestia caeni TaxID=645617 RepID=A0A397NVB8_9SPHN|nr:hypothetical protein [Hephaestia caeni]RIA37351.1 hypothetical protein DFR49_3234 [Hephaestia caeni]
MFPFLLLLGALIGLSGQEMAFARGPSMMKTVATDHQMADMEGMDCAEMMAQPQPPQDKGSKPCKGMTLDCIAQMGCALPIFVKDGPAPEAVAPTVPLPSFWPSTPRLVGRSYGPEPEPPARLS